MNPSATASQMPPATAAGQTSSTNAGYARKLVEFFALHGHYSPTQTTAGAGLTKWWTLMRKSRGEVGLTRLDDKRIDLAQDMERARQILREEIPNFRWDAPTKSEINRRNGLSHNGYARSKPVRRVRPRRLAVAEALGHLIPLATAAPFVAPEVLHIARDVVAVRIRIWEPTADMDFRATEPAGLLAEGWLTDDGVTCTGVDLAALKAQQRHDQWTPYFAHLVTSWCTVHEGKPVRISADVDIILADSLAMSGRKFGASPASREEAAAAWLARSRVGDTDRTAWVALWRNFGRLKSATAKTPQLWLRHSDQSYFDLFKAVEAYVNKQAYGRLQPTIRVLMCHLDFRYGRGARDPRTVFFAHNIELKAALPASLC